MMHIATMERPQSRSAATRPVDLVHLARQTLGDRTLEREILELFRRQSRQLLFRFETMTDPAGRADLAHTMKGSAQAIGAWRVAEAAERLEQASRAGTPTGAALAEVAETVAEAVNEIEALFADA